MQQNYCPFSTTGSEVCLFENTWRHPLTAESFPLSHFPHFTHSDLLLFGFLKSLLHHDLSRITGVLFGRNNAEHFTPYFWLLVGRIYSKKWRLSHKCTLGFENSYAVIKLWMHERIHSLTKSFWAPHKRVIDKLMAWGKKERSYTALVTFTCNSALWVIMQKVWCLITSEVFLFRIMKIYKSLLSEKMENVRLCALSYLLLKRSSQEIHKDNERATRCFFT